MNIVVDDIFLLTGIFQHHIFLPVMLTAKEIKELVAEPVTGANRLRRFMDAGHATQEQISASTRVTQPQISAIVNGRYSKLPLETARKLADYFGCSIEDLFPAPEESRAVNQ